MKIVQHYDVIEIGGEELEDILRQVIHVRTGRVLDQITWCNPVEKRVLGKVQPSLIVNLNATLKPKEDV